MRAHCGLDRLLCDWLSAEGLALQDVDVADLGVENAFVDRELAVRWSLFHQANAKLRLIHRDENLSMAKLAAKSDDDRSTPTV